MENILTSPMQTSTTPSLKTEQTISYLTQLKTYILVGCVAGATIGLELIQTRILSFLYYNNVVYLTVTIALLGFGISGVLVSLFSTRCHRPIRMISFLTAGFVFAPILCLALVSHVPAYFPTPYFSFGKLLISYIALVIPFLFAGAILGWVFMLHAKSINRLYCIDLVCSSIAVLFFVLLLWPLGGSGVVWSCSGLVLIGFLFFSHNILSKKWIGAVVVVYLGALYLVNNSLLGNQPEQYKTLGHSLNKDSQFETTNWTPITRLDVISDPHLPQFNISTNDSPHLKMLTQDGDAITVFLGAKKVASMRQEIESNHYYEVTSLIYRLNEQAKRALVIGVGGGIDVLIAKLMGAQHVTGVEINPATVQLITNSYRNYLQWPNWTGVNVVRSEGRNYVHAKTNHYDTIVMSGIDTFSALSSGAYVLSENYLYTVEAMKDYLRALTQQGTMAIHRWFFLHPRETLRLSSLYLEAAKEMHIAHPSQSIMVISEEGGVLRWATTFIKKTPFTQTEIAKMLSLIKRSSTQSVIYLPKVFPTTIQEQLEKQIDEKDPAGHFARTSFNQLITSSEKERQHFIKDYLFRIDPVHDDRPFFFEYYKDDGSNYISGLTSARGPTVLYLLLYICSLLCLSCIIFPLSIFEKRGLKTPGAVSLLMFFASLGFGYIVFEIGAMQLVSVYIGDPMYSLPLILASLLVSTGIGSAISVKFSHVSSLSVIRIASISIAAAIVLWVVFMHIIQPLTLNWGIVARATIVIVSIIPVGILLGIPFPTAIKEVDNYSSHFVPWAWGINGVTSVLASVVAIIVAMRVGFTVAILSASIAYVMSLATYWCYINNRRKISAHPFVIPDGLSLSPTYMSKENDPFTP